MDTIPVQAGFWEQFLWAHQHYNHLQLHEYYLATLFCFSVCSTECDKFDMHSPAITLWPNTTLCGDILLPVGYHFINWTDHRALVQWLLLYRLDDRHSRVQFLAGAGNFSPHYCVLTSSEAHPAFYPMGIRGSFPRS